MIVEPVRPYELNQVVNTILPGMRDVLANTRGEFTEGAILDGISAGWLQLWIGLDGEHYVGYSITKIDQFPNGKQLTILQVFSAPGAPQGFLVEGMRVMEAEAIARGCKWVAVYSQLKHNRAGADWSQRMKMLGLKPCYTEYWKEV